MTLAWRNFRAVATRQVSSVMLSVATARKGFTLQTKAISDLKTLPRPARIDCAEESFADFECRDLRGVGGGFPRRRRLRRGCWGRVG